MKKIRSAKDAVANVARFIGSHPLNQGRVPQAAVRFVKWQIRSRLADGPVVFEWIDGAKVLVRRREEGFTGNIYSGLAEFTDMGYLLHVAGKDDLFVDVGANVGSYTILACAARGASGCCFEPIPSTYERLAANIEANAMEDRVQALNMGVADREGVLTFTSGNNCTNHIVTGDDRPDDAIDVKVTTLDAVLSGRSPTIMKIDVEGFEGAVLAGAEETLRKESLHSIIMETNSSDPKDLPILEMMLDLGFRTFSYDPFARALTDLGGKSPDHGNTLFIRGVETVGKRIEAAPRARINGVEL